MTLQDGSDRVGDVVEARARTVSKSTWTKVAKRTTVGKEVWRSRLSQQSQCQYEGNNKVLAGVVTTVYKVPVHNLFHSLRILHPPVAGSRDAS